MATFLRSLEEATFLSVERRIECTLDNLMGARESAVKSFIALTTSSAFWKLGRSLLLLPYPPSVHNLTILLESILKSLGIKSFPPSRQTTTNILRSGASTVDLSYCISLWRQ